MEFTKPIEHEIKLNDPITDEQWDMLTDVDLDSVDRVWFTTKHGKNVEFLRASEGIVKVVRCKDCEYRGVMPEGRTSGFSIEWPEDSWKCPCRASDEYYSYIPEDDWFCANGKSKEEEV